MKLVGLKRAALNGRLATRGAYDAKKGRYTVTLLEHKSTDLPADRVGIALKPENLKLVDETDAEAAATAAAERGDLLQPPPLVGCAVGLSEKQRAFLL